MTSKNNSNSNARFATFSGDNNADQTIAQLQSVIENLGVNVMMSDLDLNLTYMNRRSEQTLRAVEHILQAQLGLSVDDLLNGSIDRFHGPKAGKIRAFLQDDKNLPYETEIRLGELTLSLNVCAYYDESGTYAGQVVSWTDMTAHKRELAESEGQIDAVSKAMAVISFEPDGTILDANDNFCSATGYTVEEITGKHHSTFVDSAYAASAEYKQMWTTLQRGEHISGQFKRFARDGSEVWIQASYNPIADTDGNVFKIVKYATDITSEKQQAMDFAGQMAAIRSSMAVIEFDLQGNILDANENFLAAMGYRSEEVIGKHHSMFANEEFARSAEYREMWDRLGNGETISGEFDRVGKGGRTVWIDAAYYPILDAEGRAFKVVKYASDVTERVRARDEQERGIQIIQDLVEAAKRGHLNERGDVSELTGEFRSFVNSVNEMLDAVVAPINEASQVLQGMAERDLTALVTGSYDGEYNTIKESINTAVSNMSDALRQIIDVADQCMEGSRVVSEGSNSLSEGAQAQSATVEEMSASIQSLNQMIQTVAENAKGANDTARTTTQKAEDGRVAVNKNIEAMKLIDKSAEQIGEIISVISEIAAQTNLLALNAAIEAARAGEHGLGFAVVADEVRKLAERSSRAAEEITTLIKESTQRVKEGATLSEQTGEALKSIIDGVNSTASGIGEIATATDEQAQTASEVANAIQNVASVTENNASAAEEMSGSAEELTRQAEQLKTMVSAFNVSKGDPAMR